MHKLTTVSVFVLVAGAAASGWAQPAPVTPDPGVAATRLINRDEIRISRVVLQPGAARSVHAHDDVEYHAVPRGRASKNRHSVNSGGLILTSMILRDRAASDRDRRKGDPRRAQLVRGAQAPRAC